MEGRRALPRPHGEEMECVVLVSAFFGTVQTVSGYKESTFVTKFHRPSIPVLRTRPSLTPHQFDHNVSAPYLYGSLSLHWVVAPSPEVHKAFLHKHIQLVLTNPPPYTKGPSDWVDDFIKTIKKDPLMNSRMIMALVQVNKDDKVWPDGRHDTTWAASGEDFRVRDIKHLQDALTSAISGPPEVIVVKNGQGQEIGEPIGVPIYLILDLLSNTGAGYDLFHSHEFNVAMKTLLDQWGDYLGSDSKSNSTLTQEKSGWFGPYALSVLESGLQGKTFEETYGVDPAKAQSSYKTWDAFFTREFTDIKKLRPIIASSRFPVIYNACESTSLRVAHRVALRDTFWLKGQNYSLADIFGGEPSVTPESLAKYSIRFMGGSDYHHWHSHIKGKIIEAKVLPGTYYAVLPDEGAPAADPDMQPGDPHGALLRCQPWLGHSAARGIIIIEPEEDSLLKWVAVVVIGMVEVSTIDIKINKGDVVDAGDQLGMFHFGGSSHMVIFKTKEPKKHQVVFKDLQDITIQPGQHRWVRSVIGRVEEVKSSTV
ncbi:phosphatidylserine decarboxylase-domain-containing protein [Lanmaoa asiatica]|nr:phosphatidylserine decarboxylase-domain-containing protein [Lanmaoa asiatica]